MTTIRIDQRGLPARLLARGPAFLLSLLLGLALAALDHHGRDRHDAVAGGQEETVEEALRISVRLEGADGVAATCYESARALG